MKTQLRIIIIGSCYSLLLTNPSPAKVIDIVDFTDHDPNNNSQALESMFGNSLEKEGFILQAYINGEPNGSLCVAKKIKHLRPSMGVGGQGGLLLGRSINNNGSISESIALEISPQAGNGSYDYLSAIEFSSHPATIIISGFSSDPRASVVKGNVTYKYGTITWKKKPGKGQEHHTIQFANPAATPIGTILRISNGTVDMEKSQFGLKSFSYEERAFTPPAITSPISITEAATSAPSAPLIELQQVPEPKKRTNIAAIISVSIFAGSLVILALIAILR